MLRNTEYCIKVWNWLFSVWLTETMAHYFWDPWMLSVHCGQDEHMDFAYQRICIRRIILVSCSHLPHECKTPRTRTSGRVLSYSVSFSWNVRCVVLCFPGCVVFVFPSTVLFHLFVWNSNEFSIGKGKFFFWSVCSFWIWKQQKVCSKAGLRFWGNVVTPALLVPFYTSLRWNNSIAQCGVSWGAPPFCVCVLVWLAACDPSSLPLVGVVFWMPPSWVPFTRMCLCCVCPGFPLMNGNLPTPANPPTTRWRLSLHSATPCGSLWVHSCSKVCSSYPYTTEGESPQQKPTRPTFLGFFQF